MVRLAHGSLCVMENACQFLYRHSFLPEQGADGVRVNLTFRSKQPVRPSPAETNPATEPALELVPEPAEDAQGVFVGLMDSADDHVGIGGSLCFKNMLHHPFESPFVADTPTVAAARYRAW